MRDTKHLEKYANKLAQSKKEKDLFRSQRKAVEAGAHGTLEYTIKKGSNKNKIFSHYSTSQIPLDEECVQVCKFLQILML